MMWRALVANESGDRMPRRAMLMRRGILILTSGQTSWRQPIMSWGSRAKVKANSNSCFGLLKACQSENLAETNSQFAGK
jgi:hypothetical protein